MDTLVVGVGTPQSCGLRKTALEFVQQDEPTDAGALGTRKCVLYVLVTELAYVLGSNPRFCGFDSRLGHHLARKLFAIIVNKWYGWRCES